MLLLKSMKPVTATVTFIHTSDFQLGMTRKFLPPDAQSRFDAARLEAVAKLGELARDKGAEFIVVAGDVFEHNTLEPRTHERALEVLRALPVPVYLLPGNHDPLVADSIFTRREGVAEIDGVHVLRDFDPVEVREGVEIVGAPLTTKHASEDLCARAIAPLEPSENIRVLVGHGAVEGFGDQDKASLISVAGLEEAASKGVIDYVALGDTHSTQDLSSSGRVWYSGSPETTDFHDRREGVAGGETDSGNALVVTVEKRGLESTVQVESVPVGEWTFEELAWEVAGPEDVDLILDQLRAYPHKDRTVIRYSITGTLGLEDTARLERGITKLSHAFAALYEHERYMGLYLQPSDEELANLPLSGYAREAMAELAAAASAPSLPGEASDPVVRDALNLLFRLSEEAK